MRCLFCIVVHGIFDEHLVQTTGVRVFSVLLLNHFRNIVKDHEYFENIL